MSVKSKKSFAPIIAAIVIQLCLGVAYIWSVFQTGIANSLFGGDNAAASLTFSLLLATLTIGSVIGGNLAVKYSTRAVVIAGGIILGLGFFLASFVTSSFPQFLWITYGVMGGVGMGFTYSTTIACAQKWFPEKKGLITGIIVSALGFGGVIFTPFVEWLVKVFGGQSVGELMTFRVLGAIFICVCTIGGLFLTNPPEEKSSNIADANIKEDSLTPMQMLKTPQFYLVTITFLLACMGGLMVIGFAKPIAVAKGMDSSIAMIGVLLISTFNSLGRLIWGIISDKLGRQNTILLLLIGSAILSLFVISASGYLVFVLIGLIGFFYGGLLSNFPAITAELFGAKYMSTNYGFVLLGFGAGAVISSQIAGYYRDIAGNDIELMFPAFVIASICAVTGIVMMLVLRKLSKNK